MKWKKKFMMERKFEEKAQKKKFFLLLSLGIQFSSKIFLIELFFEISLDFTQELLFYT